MKFGWRIGLRPEKTPKDKRTDPESVSHFLSTLRDEAISDCMSLNLKKQKQLYLGGWYI